MAVYIAIPLLIYYYKLGDSWLPKECNSGASTFYYQLCFFNRFMEFPFFII
jgi:hypothetical protein